MRAKNYPHSPAGKDFDRFGYRHFTGQGIPDLLIPVEHRHPQGETRIKISRSERGSIGPKFVKFNYIYVTFKLNKNL